MYNPVHFRIDDIAKIRQFIQANPLATIVATQAEHSEICPVPLVWLDDGSEFGCLIGHVARPNPLIKMADIPTWQVQFLHAGHYISPNWYPSKAQTHKEVPTWNYQAVHLTVTPTLYTDAKMLTHIVGTMTDYFEQQFNQPPDTPWSLQYATVWRTGPLANAAAVKTYFGLEGDNQVVGFVYIGTPGTELPPRAPVLVDDFIDYRG